MHFSKYIVVPFSAWIFATLSWLAVPAGVAATSTGPRVAFYGGRHRRNVARVGTGTTSVAPLPSPDFFLDGIMDRFGENGTMNQKQLQSLLHTVNAECYTVEELLDIHSLTGEQLLNDTRDVLAAVCPTVLYQTASDDCYESGTGPRERKPPTPAQVWGFGVLFVTVINLGALLGACIIPCMDKKLYKLVLTYLVGLAVGTLSGNALLGLIPETHGMFVSTHGLNFIWRNTTILGGIYLFFVVERLLKLVSLRNDTKNKKRASRHDGIMHVTAMHDMQERHDIYKITSGDSALGMNNGAVAADSSMSIGGDENHFPNTQDQNSHAHSHVALAAPEGNIQIAAVAYMIIFGDGLHNFVDGLAIGASFSYSVFQGISTSVAVICEEFPHELGDFAILLKSGMSVRQALVFNLLSALMCYIGLVVGILVGQLTSAEPYIFALAGGMFLYISLVDMLPELNTVNDQKDFNLRSSLKIFAIQNAGLLTGYGIMILLAVYGEDITVNES